MTRRRPPAGRRAGPAAVAAVLVVTALALLAGCGVPGDDKPREISRDALGPPLKDRSPTTSAVRGGPAVPTHAETGYLVRTSDTGDNERLEAVPIDVANPTEQGNLVTLVIERLIALKPDQLGLAGLVNAVPSDTQVRSATVGPDGVLQLDLANLGNIESSLQRLAVAQLVFTATGIESEGVRSVVFSIDGQPTAVPTETGTATAGTAVSRADYPKFLDQVQSVAPTAGSG